MPRFTGWRKLADSTHWYDDEFDYDGPACYELGVGHSRSRVRPTYVGETKSESARISSYGAGHSHLSKTIDSYLRRGFNLYYRGMAVSSKAEAKAMQDNYLSEYDYEWNTQGQGEDA